MEDDAQKQQIISRLRSIEGHIRGIERMVTEDAYCIEVMKQTLAVQKALDKLNTLILQDHLENCVTDAIRGQSQRAREKAIGEIVDVFEMSNKV